LSMLLVSGLQLLLVARLDYAALPSFAIASSLSLFMTGISQAVASTAIPEAATLQASGNNNKLYRLISGMTLATCILSSLAAIILISGSGPIMLLWGGCDISMTGTPLLAILVLAQALRNSMLAYTMVAIGTGLQRKMLVTPILEGLSCFISSIILGSMYGAVGIACGMLIGSIIGVVLLLRQNIIKSLVPEFNIWTFFKYDILPAQSGTLIIAAVYWTYYRMNATSLLQSFVISILVLTIYSAIIFKLNIFSRAWSYINIR
jgi:O-antigen/teichoic acid export membrane protein